MQTNSDSPIHLRCAACKLHLAGPIQHAPSPKHIQNFDDCAVAVDAFFTVAEIQFPINELFNFSFESPNDLYLHPQWTAGWRENWPDFAKGTAQRKLFAIAKGSGCCGPQGTVECCCGIRIGRIMADCISTQWMLLFDSKIERSDRHDGEWMLHADTGQPMDWYEDTGVLINNRRVGEWERWLVVPQYVAVQRRDKDRQPVNASQERLERRLVASSLWMDGELVSSVTE